MPSRSDVITTGMTETDAGTLRRRLLFHYPASYTMFAGEPVSKPAMKLFSSAELDRIQNVVVEFVM